MNSQSLGARVLLVLMIAIGVAVLGLIAILIVLSIIGRAATADDKRVVHLAANLTDLRLEAVQGAKMTLRNTSDRPHLSTLYVMSDGDLRNGNSTTDASKVLFQYRFSAPPRATQTIDNTETLTNDLAGRRVVQETRSGERFVDIVGIVEN